MFTFIIECRLICFHLLMILFHAGGSSSQCPPTSCNKELVKASNIIDDQLEKEEPAKISEGSGQKGAIAIVRKYCKPKVY